MLSHLPHLVGSLIATVICEQSEQCQAGILCPHQICRDMHQSRMFLIHSNYVFSQLFGTKVISPSSTAFMAGPASGATLTNQCFERRGSTTVWHL